MVSVSENYTSIETRISLMSVKKYMEIDENTHAGLRNEEDK
jgi:hypothetical protein